MITRAVLVLAAAALMASGPPPEPDASSAPLAVRSASRFPQPVRVGDLIGRDVLKPVEAQPVLGRVKGIVRRPDGALDLVMSRGGVLGIGARLIAVPLDAAALLGEYVAVIDLTLAQLDALPTVAAPAAPLPPDATISMGLVRPFH